MLNPTFTLSPFAATTAVTTADACALINAYQALRAPLDPTLQAAGDAAVQALEACIAPLCTATRAYFDFTQARPVSAEQYHAQRATLEAAVIQAVDQQLQAQTALSAIVSQARSATDAGVQAEPELNAAEEAVSARLAAIDDAIAGMIDDSHCLRDEEGRLANLDDADAWAQLEHYQAQREAILQCGVAIQAACLAPL